MAAAATEAAARVRAELAGAAPNLVVAFISAQHATGYNYIPKLLALHFPSATIIGCSAGGVIGGGKEVEQRPGLSLTAAVLPGVDLSAFHVESTESFLSGWAAERRRVAAALPHFLLLGDPFSFDAESFVRALDHHFPTSRKIGGLASGGQQPGANVLFIDATPHRAGLVGVALSGRIEIDTIVAQGCRPIGQPMFVTKCQGNILWELDGQPAVHVLHGLYQTLPAADQELARHSLFLGMVMNEHQHEYRQGDFLIRNIIGMDTERGVLAVAATPRENAVVQFHLRDAHTSAQDLDHLLSGYRTATEGSPPQGALLFSCLGRGLQLYGKPDHDTGAFRAALGDVPLGGFFCNGEIGPVQGTTFLHGYTSAFGLFRPGRS
jgi:small ligand-binding sensory domain FIST